jgi:sugar phosphate permease
MSGSLVPEKAVGGIKGLKGMALGIGGSPVQEKAVGGDLDILGWQGSVGANRTPAVVVVADM